MNRPIRLLSSLLVLLFQSAYGGITDSVSTPGSWSISVQLHGGFMMAHRPSVVYLQEGHAIEGEFTLCFSSKPDKIWAHQYNFPITGFSYRIIDFGNREKIGLAHCFYPQVLFPVFKESRLALLARLGLGIGYVEKPFDSENNYKNLTIGSHLNAAVLFGLQGRIRSSKRLQITGGIDFFHLSNGASKVPNLGINIPSINFGLLYFGGKAIHCRRVLPEKVPSRNETGVYFAQGFNEKYPPGGPTYWIQVLNGFFQRTWGRKGIFGAGADYIYDPSIPAALSDENKAGNFFSDASRAGVYGSIGLRMSRFDILFQTGTYLHNNDKSDGDIYSRLCLRYKLNNHFFAGAHLKSHYGKADYAEWAIGYIF